MIPIDRKKKRAFTLVELMVTILIASIVFLGVGVLMVDSIKGYNKLYDRRNKGIVQDAYAARLTFDRIVRRASTKRYTLGLTSVEVYYYGSPPVLPDGTDPLDRYAKIYESGGNLYVEYGNYDDATHDTAATNTSLVAENVADAKFSVEGARVSMVLELDDGKRTMTVMSSAVRHNE